MKNKIPTNVPTIALKAGQKIRAKKDLFGINACFEYSTRIFIPKGAILKIPSIGTKWGDVFTDVIEGVCILKSREHGDLPLKARDRVGLTEGHDTCCPCDLGRISLEHWEIV
jgi:hypothetical protein